MKKKKTQWPSIAEAFSWSWFLVFVGFLLAHSSDTLPPAHSLFLVFIFGLIYVVQFQRDDFISVLKEHKPLWMACGALATWIFFSESIALQFYGQPYDEHASFFTPLILCAPILATLLLDTKKLQALVLFFITLCAWHLFAMPIEAITGYKLSWFPSYVSEFKQTYGIFSYQPSGLSIRPYYYPGFYLPIFYLAFGSIWERHVFKEKKIADPLFFLAALLWLIPSICVLSRSVLVGTLLATFVFIINPKKISAKYLLAIPAISIAAFLLYKGLALDQKSGFGLRGPYMQAYFLDSLRWPYILTGHGFTYNRLLLWIPGIQFMYHSHNDLIEVLFIWGAPGVIAYLTMWVFILRIVFKDYFSKGETWPLAAIVAILPHMITDLGLVHFEKAIFFGFLISFLIALKMRKRLKASGNAL